MSASAALLSAFDRQVDWCAQGASPFSARVLARSRLWLAQHEEALSEIAAVADDPLAAAVSLRWLSGLHHLALLGREPWASLWPPVGTETSDEDLDAALDVAILLAWREQRAHLRAALSNAPQTNEVQRSAALLPGLLHVAARTGLPLALAEIGSSAGLNLWCDHFRHDHGSWRWGDPAAPLTLSADWQGPPPPLPALLIQRRAGCDRQPVDLQRPGEDLRLASFIWADQADRLARLRAAIEVALEHMSAPGAGLRPARPPWGSRKLGTARRFLVSAQDVRIQALPASEFVRQQLAQRQPGQAWVLMHSVVWQYLPAAEQADIRAQMQAAAAKACLRSPLAWLRFEPPRPDLRMELRCSIWPGAEDRLLALCHPHGARVEWQGVAAD